KTLSKTARFYPDSCRSFGSGAVQPFNGTLFHVRSDCTCTLTSFTHNRVDCTITTRRGRNGLQEHVEILINRIRTVLHNGSIQVEETKKYVT
uniref:VWFD domain-containing protein n=1 Tax=Periophthalmus magnuspinnatus TaxID=409849 RepID=A0A3B4A260_9GOBI